MLEIFTVFKDQRFLEKNECLYMYIYVNIVVK